MSCSAKVTLSSSKRYSAATSLSATTTARPLGRRPDTGSGSGFEVINQHLRYIYGKMDVMENKMEAMEKRVGNLETKWD